MAVRNELTYLFASMQYLRGLPQLSDSERADLLLPLVGEVGRLQAAGLTTPWVPNTGPQALTYLSPADETFYGGSAGGGKLAPLDTHVLTPFGWQCMGDMKVGSRICATDGTTSTVIAVHPQGIKDIYRVTMRDGGSCEVGLEHLWLAWKTHASTKKGGIPKSGSSAAKKYTTGQIMAEMSKGYRVDGRKYGFAIPVTSPVAFNVAGACVGRGNFVGRPVDPYLLGLLIGDGCYTTKQKIDICSADADIQDWVLGHWPGDVRISAKADNAAVSLALRGESLIHVAGSLESLGMIGKRAATKSIPRQYLLAPTEDRWALLQGLMDSDGWVEEKRAVYYTTVSPQLVEDVVFLARSLGAVTSVTDKLPTYTYKGETLDGQPAFCVRMRFPNPEMCFRLSRKKILAADVEHQSEGRFIESIEFSRRAEAQCITVSHPNSLYITDDFIVTHNSWLLLGLALTAHTRSLILRMNATNLQQLKDDLLSMIGTKDHWRAIGYGGILATADGRKIEMHGCESAADARKYMGRAHSLKGYDELATFTEETFRFVNAWNRTTIPGERCRVVGAGNPPTRPEEEWVLRYWAPWLDAQHSNPAEPGELRWFAVVDGKDLEVATGDPFPYGKETIYPRSRTFIPARLEDNPDLERTGYRATLQGLPEPLRSQLLYGAMDAGRADDDWQLIPTSWVRDSMRRWTADGGDGKALSCSSLDVAMMGGDRACLAKRYQRWIAPLRLWAGKDIPDGPSLAQKVLPSIDDLTVPLLVDVLATAGGSAVTAIKAAFPRLPVVPINFGSGSTFKDRTGRLEMRNTRAEAYYRLREALDPNQPIEKRLILPSDSELLAEICATRWEISAGKVKIEDKEEIKKRIGRSPDKADAVAMSLLFDRPTNGGWVMPLDDKPRPKSAEFHPPSYGGGGRFMGVEHRR